VTPRFEIRSLGRWDRPQTDPRKSSATFRASWADTVKLLLAEVDMLGGQLVVLQVDADPTEIRLDGMLRARASVDFPGVKVSFESDHGPLMYATDAYDRTGWGMAGWQANVRAIALGLGALRAVDRYGITSSGEQYKGWTALADKPFAHTAEMAPDVADRILRDAAGNVSYPFDTPSRINAAFRMAARTHHPDVGGNDEAFQLLSSARDALVGAIRDGAR
jgi:hypothetical protein